MTSARASDTSPRERQGWEKSGRSPGAALSEDGFALIPNLASGAVAATARASLTAAVAKLADTDRPPWRNPKGSCQVAWASRLVPGLVDSPIRAAARSLAAEIIGGRVVERFDYALVTPPGGPGAPWHRDEESFVLSGVRRRVHVWVALEDIDESNGCLSYVPRGSAQDRPEDMAVVCPTPAGTALVHNEHTLHCSGSNCSVEPRWAWILQFAAARPVATTLFALDRTRANLILAPVRRRLAAPARG